MKKFLALSTAIVLTLLPGAHGQNLTVSTLAGNAGQTSTDGSDSSARFNNPWGVVADATGSNFYVADTDSHCIRKVTSAGVVTTFAGVIGVSGTNDSASGTPHFNSPMGVAIDATGNLYVTDSGNNTIRKITSGGVVTTLAGSPTLSGSSDGSGSAARFNQPEGIALTGTTLYVADTFNHTIRAVTTSGSVSTYAGTAGTPGFANLTGTSATFNTPQGVAVDASGNVYVADTGNQLIRLIASGAVVSTFAGVTTNTGSGNGASGSATFWDPVGIAVSGSTVYVADSMNNTIRKISAGSVSTPVGSAGNLGSADGSGSVAQFWQPQGLCVDISGNVYVADGGNGTIRKIIGTTVSTLAGSPSVGSSDGNASTARFFFPGGACIDSSGNVYVADTQNHTIRMVTSGGVASTVAGAAGVSGSSDGPTNSARFNAPQGICRDSSGNIYVADTGNHTIRKISGTTVSLLAGTAGTSGVADGTGSAAQFNSPTAVAVDSSGNVYVADTGNHTIRKITSGVVTTLAGIAGSYGTSDGTGANVGTNGARFFAPGGVAVDAAGNVYVADTLNHTIRKITSGGVVSTIAGLGGSYGSTDNTNGATRFYMPEGIAVDPSGNLFVLDSGNHSLRKLTASGTNWIASTVAGTSGLAGTADGVGGGARFFHPAGLGVNLSSTVAIADLGNDTIRTALNVTGTPPAITGQPQSQTVVKNNTATFTVTATGTAPLSYQWYFNSGAISGASTSTYTKSNVQTTDAGSYSVTVTNIAGTTPSLNAILTVTVPPSISTQPQNQTVSAGTTATFSVVASGTTPLSYQWFFGASQISGATSSTYSVTNAQTANVGSYSVTVTNVAGSLPSSPATLSVTPAGPTITSQPQNQVVPQTTSATFSVVASGSSPLSYQWLFNGGVIGGAIASSYTIASAQPSNVGSYSVIVTNQISTTTSSAATLTLSAVPVITTQPTNQLTFVGSNATFSVAAVGGGLNYQWQLNGGTISGATLSAYNISPVQWANAGTYSVIVTNAAGSATSSNATLVVQQTPQTFFDGFETYNLGCVDNDFSGGPNANPALDPWWSLSTSTPKGGVTNANTGVTPHGGAQMLGVVNAGTTLAQDYYNLIYRLNSGSNYYGNIMCDWWFYDPYGATQSTATNLQQYVALCQAGPVPTNTDATNTFASFTQRMSLGAYNGNVGYDFTKYQARIIGGTGGTFGAANSWYNTTTTRSVGWHHGRIVVGIATANAAPISMYIDNMTNATVSSPTVANVGYDLIELNNEMSKSGFYGYYDDVTFRAANDPWIVEQPQSTTIFVGQSTSVTTVAIGTSYQWLQNGNPISGATTTTYSIASADGPDAGTYTCAITGTNGTIFTSGAVVDVVGPPHVTQQPATQTVNQGQSAVFSVATTGSLPFTYQWQFNDAPISGATDSSYTVTNATAADAGSYRALITNSVGNTTSSEGILTVIVPPAISTQPANATANQGQNAVFSIAASGTLPFNYQWRFNGGNIPGANSSSYTKTSVQGADAGSYSVVITNSAGMTTSSNAVLTVIVAPLITTQPTSQTVLEGSTVTFSGGASGTSPGYQWRFNGVPIANAHGTSYQQVNVQLSNAGSYSLVASNNAGTSTSSDAVLNVVQAQTILSNITANPDNSISMVWQVDPNTNYTLQYKASLLDAQWNNLSNVTPSTATLSISDAPGADVQRTYQLATSQSVSELGGFLQLSLLGNSDNFVSIPFGRAPAIPALVSSVAGNVITASGSPGWMANQFVYVSGTQSNTYFVRFTSGAAAGKVYPIAANTANSLTVNLGSDSLAAVAANDAFSIEAYWTLGTVFPNGKGVNVSPTTGNRNTEVLIPDMTSTGINLSASKIYFFNSGIWKQVGQGNASFNDDILQPNIYFVVRHNVATNTTLTAVGRVISTPIAVTLATDSASLQDNYIGLQRPVPVSLNDSGLIESGAFNVSPLPGSRTDELLTFDNSQIARNKSSNASYYYWQGAWRQVGSGTNDFGSALIFQPGTGVIIRKGTNNATPVWTNNATWTQ